MKKSNKSNASKLLWLIIYMSIGGIMGFLIGKARSSGLELPKEYRALSTWLNILIFIGTYIVTVAFHEMGHFLSFLRNGIKMRALIITIFVFITEQGSWKLKIRPNNVTGTGGIAVPDLEVVKGEDDFSRLQKAYAKAIIAGPIASIIFLFAGILISIPIMLLTTNVYLKSFLLTFVISLIIITFVLLASSFINNEIAIGDFPAYKLAKKDTYFIAIQLYQYALFSSYPDEVRKENTYLRNVLLRELEKKLADLDTHVFTLSIIDAFLVEYLSDLVNELPCIVIDYIEFLQESPEAINKILTSENALILWFHIIRFNHLNESTQDKANALYSRIKELKKLKSPVELYLAKQTDHLLGIKDNSQYLLNKNNIRISSAHGLWKNFEGYFLDEIRLNEMTINQ
ncbi:M50 family metallopeptidase [Alkaliphilus transvaalensis]|uniref:M50 family metallopeptidase n=1 Tax=Alkaliphilus transvaalensis TaxID=114628 RepID=UPI00047C7311|nr:M50 family metallopeptidase [Alkaliphilus transvaalensis]